MLTLVTSILEHPDQLVMDAVLRPAGPPRYYRVIRHPQGVRARTPTNKPLPLRLDIYNHSPTGFEWGYLGSGPAQLSLALLAHVAGLRSLSKRTRARRLRGEIGQRVTGSYQDFKVQVVSEIPQHLPAWSVAADDVRRWLEAGPVARHEIAGAMLRTILRDALAAQAVEARRS